MAAVSSTAFLHPPQFLGAPFGSTDPLPVSPRPPILLRFRGSPTAAAYTSAERPQFNYCSKKTTAASLYDVLGVPFGSSALEIKAAYRKLVRICHPDVVAIDRKLTSTDDFIRIHSAYATLSDPEKRANYDRKLQFRQRSFSFPASSSSSYSSFSGYSSRRTWETDQCW